MGSPISEQVLQYHLDAGPEFNTLFVSSASISWMDGAVRYYGGAQSERRGTALRLADLAIQVCESIPITDKKKQKWLVEGFERLRMSKEKISQDSSMREDWVTPEEYAPRRPWKGIEQRETTFPLFGREIKASAGVVVVMDLSGIDAGERSQTLNGLRLAVNESG